MAVLNVRRALLIANPASKRGHAVRGDVERAFARANVELEVRLTSGSGEATALATSLAHAHDAVFALGGDGTVSEVAAALAGTSVPLGILPAGTGNLVARALRIPMRPAEAVGALVTGQCRRFDVGRMGDGRCVVFAAGTGIDAEMIARATPALKRRWGVATYFATGTRAAFARQGFHVHAIVDGRSIQRKAWAVFIANFGSVLGGLIHLGPDILPDDGMLDLCVLSPANVPDAIAMVWRMFRSDFRPHPRMTFFRGREIELLTMPARPVQSDGEYAGQTPVRVRVEAGALTLLVPAPR